jgi:uncharacterized protein YbjT (DUF2867 family)
MILVIGSTGTTGRFVLERLSAAGVPTRALVRPAAARPALRRLPGVEVVLGDAGDPPSLRAALQGVDRVFMAMGNGPDQLDRELAVVREAVHSGVTRLVKVSAPLVGPDVPVAVARMHYEVEQAVLATGLDHTFLRPYAFLQNLLNVAPTVRLAGFFSGITGDTPMNMVDARDIADVAVVALATDRGRGPLVLTGPETVSYPEVARRLTALGRPTRYVDLDPEDYRRSLRRAGLPPWLVEHLAEIQALALTHPESPTGTVAALIGRPPRTLDAFLAENLASFAAPLSWREHLAALPLRVVAARTSAGKVFEHEVA